MYNYARFLLVIILSTLLASCATAPQNISNGYDIQQKKNEKHKYGYITIEYRDYDIVVENEKSRLNDSMATEEQREEVLSTIPKGGMIIVDIRRITIETANTNVFEYIVHKNGEEVFRKAGRNSIANPPASGDLWWNVDVVELPNPIENSIQFFVVDKVIGGRDEFIITKKSNIK